MAHRNEIFMYKIKILETQTDCYVNWRTYYKTNGVAFFVFRWNMIGIYIKQSTFV